MCPVQLYLGKKTKKNLYKPI